MTAIRALEREAPTPPLEPAMVERREGGTIRHGSQTLIAGFDVAGGEASAVIHFGTKGKTGSLCSMATRQALPREGPTPNREERFTVEPVRVFEHP